MGSIFRKNILVFLLLFLAVISCSKDDSVQNFTLTTNVVPEEGGSLSVESGTHAEGEEVTIVATPSEGFVFKNWEGDLSGADNPAKINMSSDRNITAVFEKSGYAISSEIIGKWYIRHPSGEILAPQNKGTEKQSNDTCILYSIQFTEDGNFRLVTEQGGLSGLYNVTGEDSIDLGIGFLLDVSITDGSLQFQLELTTGCSSENTALPLTYVPDDAFESHLINIGEDDVPDDFVRTKNILSLSGLSIVSNTLHNMTGVEDFKNLSYLKIFTTPDATKDYTLDVTQNKNLRSIEIGGYRIRDLDLSQNRHLEDLRLYTTDVRELDLSNNARLKALIIYSNYDYPAYSFDLDFTMNLELEEVDIENTFLGEVDITKNHNLKRFSIQESVSDLKMAGSYEHLTYLSVSGSSPYVKKLDFSGFPNLETLYLTYDNVLDLSSNSRLKLLKMVDFKGTTIDLSGNPLIDRVFIERAPNLSCIQVNEEQKAKIENSEMLTWSVEGVGYSLDCN